MKMPKKIKATRASKQAIHVVKHYRTIQLMGFRVLAVMNAQSINTTCSGTSLTERAIVTSSRRLMKSRKVSCQISKTRCTILTVFAPSIEVRERTWPLKWPGKYHRPFKTRNKRKGIGKASAIWILNKNLMRKRSSFWLLLRRKAERWRCTSPHDLRASVSLSLQKTHFSGLLVVRLHMMGVGVLDRQSQPFPTNAHLLLTIMQVIPQLILKMLQTNQISPIWRISIRIMTEKGTFTVIWITKKGSLGMQIR